MEISRFLMIAMRCLFANTLSYISLPYDLISD